MNLGHIRSSATPAEGQITPTEDTIEPIYQDEVPVGLDIIRDVREKFICLRNVLKGNAWASPAAKEFETYLDDIIDQHEEKEIWPEGYERKVK